MISKYPLATSSWDQAEYDALGRVIKSNQFSMGPEVRHSKNNSLASLVQDTLLWSTQDHLLTYLLWLL